MNVYEFILVLTSIIVGLGVAELFGGVVRILRGELKVGALHSVWVSLVFFFQVQWLWATWELHDRGDWLFPEFILFMIGPIGLYMVAAILFPAVDTGESLDVHLQDRRGAFFVVLALTFASFSAADWLVANNPVGDQDIARGIGIVLCGILAKTRHKVVHWMTALFILGALVWFTSTFTLRIG
jgi:hypothetical protein